MFKFYGRSAPLNEGRGRDPGDTFHVEDDRPALEVRSTKAGVETPATRRGSKRLGTFLVRSTKAGVETPATPFKRTRVGRGSSIRSTKAGVETPATHSLLRPDVCERLRSTKAGVETPATQFDGEVLAGAVLRSTKAGVETPATLSLPSPAMIGGPDAQRRPGSRPRRHLEPCRRGMRWLRRSTKAGVETPATRRTHRLDCRMETALNEGRGRDPGDTSA